ncbi:hypothetical protein XF_1208 [Xylella fastidiosa 9a5c]|uniref:Uncharacterized protein n=1 Tax=Xylella fastidiosa (strain 9a5c) TaxID=160492 RepID=Q9PE20_XYLFA|nr:hypothetical protein XF_1208 [Xylella fastidiosa 9a5c]
MIVFLFCLEMLFVKRHFRFLSVVHLLCWWSQALVGCFAMTPKGSDIEPS